MIKYLINRSAKFVMVALNNLMDHFWDYRLGINTRGIHPGTGHSRFGDGTECEPTRYRQLLKVMRSLPLERMESEVFVDYGCGKGRAVCLFAQKPFRKIVGIELSSKWADVASRNVDALNMYRAKDVEIINEDAVNFDPKEGTIFYFYNPFGADTFKSVLKNIYASLQINPRRVFIVYFNTVCRDIIDNEDWLTFYKVNHTRLNGEHAIVTYKHTPMSGANAEW